MTNCSVCGKQEERKITFDCNIYCGRCGTNWKREPLFFCGDETHVKSVRIDLQQKQASGFHVECETCGMPCDEFECDIVS